MAIERFEQALAAVLKHEGGYVNHPDDPGGATNQGVTQTTYDNWRSARDLARRSVQYIEAEEVSAIYRTLYWNNVGGNYLPSGLDYATFDYGVHSGPSKAVKDLQRVVGAPSDGRVGPITLEAVGQFDTREAIKQLCARRGSFLQALKHFKTFGRGWMRRLAEVEAKALSWVATPMVLRAEAAEAKDASNRHACGAAVGTGAGAVETVNPVLPATANVVIVGLILCAVVFFAYHAYRNRVRAAAITAGVDHA